MAPSSEGRRASRSGARRAYRPRSTARRSPRRAAPLAVEGRLPQTGRGCRPLARRARGGAPRSTAARRSDRRSTACRAPRSRARRLALNGSALRRLPQTGLPRRSTARRAGSAVGGPTACRLPKTWRVGRPPGRLGARRLDARTRAARSCLTHPRGVFLPLIRLCCAPGQPATLVPWKGWVLR